MKNLFKALLKAQQAMGAATKDASNPFFKSKYADYGAVLEAVKGPLNDNGILMLQPHVFQDGKSFVKTVLVHAESGETYDSLTEVVCAKQNDPQALGSAITYARRYGLQSLPCLPTEDDDGNAGSGKIYTTANKAPTQQAPKVVEAKKAEPVKPMNAIAALATVTGSGTPLNIKMETPKAQPAVAAKVQAGW